MIKEPSLALARLAAAVGVLAGLSGCSSNGSPPPAPSSTAFPLDNAGIPMPNDQAGGPQRAGASSTGLTAADEGLPVCRSGMLAGEVSLNGAAGSITFSPYLRPTRSAHPDCRVRLVWRAWLINAGGAKEPVEDMPMATTITGVVRGGSELFGGGIFAWENWCQGYKETRRGLIPPAHASGPAIYLRVSAGSLPPRSILIAGEPACTYFGHPSVIRPFTSAGPGPYFTATSKP